MKKLIIPILLLALSTPSATSNSTEVQNLKKKIEKCMPYLQPKEDNFWENENFMEKRHECAFEIVDQAADKLFYYGEYCDAFIAYSLLYSSIDADEGAYYSWPLAKVYQQIANQEERDLFKKYERLGKNNEGIIALSNFRKLIESGNISKLKEIVNMTEEDIEFLQKYEVKALRMEVLKEKSAKTYEETPRPDIFNFQVRESILLWDKEILEATGIPTSYFLLRIGEYKFNLGFIDYKVFYRDSNTKFSPLSIDSKNFSLEELEKICDGGIK